MDEPSLRKTQWYSLAIVIFAGDQAAKSYIDATTPLGWSHEVASFFNLVHALNPGAAFSFLAGAGGWQRWFFLAIAFAISAWLAWLLSRPLRKTEGLSYSLILGGIGQRVRPRHARARYRLHRLSPARLALARLQHR